MTKYGSTMCTASAQKTVLSTALILSAVKVRRTVIPLRWSALMVRIVFFMALISAVHKLYNTPGGKKYRVPT